MNDTSIAVPPSTREGMGQPARLRLGRIGIWSLELRYGDPNLAIDAAAELDELGYGAIWIPGGIGGDVTGDIDRLTNATQNAVIATGILNIWKHDAKDIGAWWSSGPKDKASRIMLGLGVSHGPLIGDAWGKPLTAMGDYLDQLTGAGLPADNLCLAALGPKMLELARHRTAGAHPYLVPPEHSAIAREILGPDAILAPEVGVILERDPAKAREIARGALTNYLALPNYVKSWHRLGFTEDDTSHASDRLIDALFAWGDTKAVVERVSAHLSAGANHVCMQVISGQPKADANVLRPLWRELASALLTV
jgi:probable F420-dependent oxidoreductase